MPTFLPADADLPAHTAHAKFTSPASFHAPASTADSHGLIDQIAYCSVATPSVEELGMAHTIASHSGGNASLLTGILMWEGRLLIHWLEGSSHAIDALWEDIENDPHQHCVVPLLRKRGAAQRLFEGWKMQPTSRNEMMAIVREAKEQMSRSSDPQGQQWQHAISTLSILLDAELTACYAQTAGITARTTALQIQEPVAQHA